MLSKLPKNSPLGFQSNSRWIPYGVIQAFVTYNFRDLPEANPSESEHINICEYYHKMATVSAVSQISTNC
jgi:hypothetical protein